MNVQEINGTGHHIWNFVVTAVVMLLMSLLSWLLWRAWRNIKFVLNVSRVGRDHDQRVSLYISCKHALQDASRELGRQQTWWTRFGLLVGWQSAEKTVKPYDPFP